MKTDLLPIPQKIRAFLHDPFSKIIAHHFRGADTVGIRAEIAPVVARIRHFHLQEDMIQSNFFKPLLFR